MMIASGAPPMLAGLTMAFHTNLFGAITHYASGQGAVYFGGGGKKNAPYTTGRSALCAPVMKRATTRSKSIN